MRATNPLAQPTSIQKLVPDNGDPPIDDGANTPTTVFWLTDTDAVGVMPMLDDTVLDADADAVDDTD